MRDAPLRRDSKMPPDTSRTLRYGHVTARTSKLTGLEPQDAYFLGTPTCPKKILCSWQPRCLPRRSRTSESNDVDLQTTSNEHPETPILAKKKMIEKVPQNPMVFLAKTAPPWNICESFPLFIGGGRGSSCGRASGRLRQRGSF